MRSSHSSDFGRWSSTIQRRLPGNTTDYGIENARSPSRPTTRYAAEFNADRKPAKLLYLLARCVKNAVRFNPAGEFNQSPDKRRTGTRPHLMKAELFLRTESLLAGVRQSHADFFRCSSARSEGEFFYLDPPYQGTSEGRDQRYIAGVSRDRMIEALTILNEKRIPFILSYDGSCGERNYGEPLPSKVAHRILLDVGRSSQATLNGRDDVTIESLYVSHYIPATRKEPRFRLRTSRTSNAIHSVLSKPA